MYTYDVHISDLNKHNSDINPNAMLQVGKNMKMLLIKMSYLKSRHITVADFIWEHKSCLRKLALLHPNPTNDNISNRRCRRITIAILAGGGQVLEAGRERQ